MSEYGGTPSADSYYERLGIDRNASEERVTTASKQAKRAVHPDSNSSDQATAEAEFDRVTDAAETLTDPNARAAYDTFLDEQGAETGTKRYEEWEQAGRPKSPTEWLSSAPEAESTVEVDPRQGWTATEWNTTRDGERDASAADEGPAQTTTVDADPSTTVDADPTTTNTDSTVDPNTTTTGDPNRTTIDPNTETIDPNRGTVDPNSTAETTTRTTVESEEPSNPQPTPNRAPPSVLGEDPDELYSKYVLDSDAAWGHPEESAGGEAGETATAWYIPDAFDTSVQRVAASPVGVLLQVDAPQSWLARLALVAVWLAIAVVVGAAGELIALLAFVFIPRIGPWLYTSLAVIAWGVPTLWPLETGAGIVTGYAAVAVGYALVVRGIRAETK